MYRTTTSHSGVMCCFKTKRYQRSGLQWTVLRKRADNLTYRRLHFPVIPAIHWWMSVGQRKRHSLTQLSFKGQENMSLSSWLPQCYHGGFWYKRRPLSSPATSWRFMTCKVKSSAGTQPNVTNSHLFHPPSVRRCGFLYNELFIANTVLGITTKTCIQYNTNKDSISAKHKPLILNRFKNGNTET